MGSSLLARHGTAAALLAALLSAGAGVASAGGAAGAGTSGAAGAPTATSAIAPVRPNLAEGGFIVDCDVSHANNYDPILRPRVITPGHMHHYFGNPETDAFSTPSSLRDATGSKPENKSAYWIPALYEGDGNVIAPDRAENYYRDGGVDAVAAMVPFDVDHSMVAGNAGLKASDPLQAKNVVQWACTIEGDTGGQDNKGSSTINKALNKVAHGATTCREESMVGGYEGMLRLLVTFPNCWDGNTEFPGTTAPAAPPPMTT